MHRSAEAPASERGASSSTLLILFGGVFLGALDIAIVGPALPAIQQDLALTSRQLALIFSVYILFSIVAAPLIASLSDRRGRRQVYVGCLTVFGTGSLIVATASTLDVLLLGRAVQAIGAGGTLPVASAVIADTFPLHRRGRALGLIGAVFGLAFVLGPLVGAILLQWTWRWLFLVNLPLVVVLAVASLKLLEDRPQRVPRAFDLAGTALLAVGLAALAYGATRLELDPERWIETAVGSGVSFGVALVLLWLFLRTESRAESPVIEPKLLTSTQMRVIAGLGFATGLVEASMVFLPTLAVAALDVEPSRASFMLAPLVVALIAGSVIAGRVLDRVGAKPVIQAGMTLTIIGLLLFSLLPLGTASFYTAGIVVGFGLASLLGAPLRFAALEEGGESSRGASQGILTVALGVGRLFGASMIGGIAAGATAAPGGYRRSMFVIAMAVLVALLVSVKLRGSEAAKGS